MNKRKEYLLRMSEELHLQLKIKTITENTTMMEYIVEAIKEKLERDSKKEA